MKHETSVKIANGSVKIMTSDVKSRVERFTKPFISRLLLIGILLPGFFSQFIAGCYWAHRDDVVPTPYLTTPVTPNLGLANVIARSVKLVDITIEIIEPAACFGMIPYNRTRLEFSKFGDGEILKTIEPIRKRMNFNMRLEQGEKYRFSLRSMGDEKLDRVVVADSNDIRIELNSLCRK
jgi:hypothetical protein